MQQRSGSRSCAKSTVAPEALAKQVGGTSACFNTSLRLQPGAKLPTRNRPWLLGPLIQRYRSALFRKSCLACPASVSSVRQLLSWRRSNHSVYGELAMQLFCKRLSIPTCLPQGFLLNSEESSVS